MFEAGERTGLAPELPRLPAGGAAISRPSRTAEALRQTQKAPMENLMMHSTFFCRAWAR